MHSHPRSLLTIGDVAERLRLTKKAFHGLRRRAPDFPPPIMIGPRTFRWKEEDLNEWLSRNQKETSLDENEPNGGS